MEDFMSILIAIGTIMVIFMSYLQYKSRKDDMTDDHEDETVKDETDMSEKNIGTVPRQTKKLLVETLRGMGCEPEDDGNGEFMVEYQGAYFRMHIEPSSPFITVLFLFWYEFSSYDIDMFSVMQKAVNDANRIYSTTVFYVVDKDSETVYLHSTKQVIFIPQIPRKNEYLRSVFRDLFFSRQFVYSALSKAQSDEADDD